MLFSSMTFVFLFLPLVCFAYLTCRKELHNSILLVASVLFYAWGEPEYLAVMIITILVNYCGALVISGYDAAPGKRKLAVILTIGANLGFLVYFKYTNFLIDIFNSAAGGSLPPINVVMPIGISFYTFQAMSYVLDVYRRETAAQKDVYKLALYITLFPQLVAGPIVKYHDIADQIDSRDVNIDKISLGIKRFIIGLAKKMLIANTMGAVADKVFVQSPLYFDTATAWIGALTYSLQIYYDFSGYSDMAIGLCLIFGFKIPENFNYPYISKSITEFWRRWHISLSTWFKQYVYIPLGGNRVSHARTYFNLCVVFLLTGIWHGASWNFVVWGLWNGFFIIFEKATGWSSEKRSPFLRLIQHIYTIFVFVIGWVLFRSNSLESAWMYIKNMFGFITPKNISYGLFYYIDKLEILMFAFGIIFSMPILKNMLNISKDRGVLRTGINLMLLALFAAAAASVAASTYNPFIYFRF